MFLMLMVYFVVITDTDAVGLRDLGTKDTFDADDLFRPSIEHFLVLFGQSASSRSGLFK